MKKMCNIYIVYILTHEIIEIPDSISIEMGLCCRPTCKADYIFGSLYTELVPYTLCSIFIILYVLCAPLQHINVIN